METECLKSSLTYTLGSIASSMSLFMLILSKNSIISSIWTGDISDLFIYFHKVQLLVHFIVNKEYNPTRSNTLQNQCFSHVFLQLYLYGRFPFCLCFLKAGAGGWAEGKAARMLEKASTNDLVYINLGQPHWLLSKRNSQLIQSSKKFK